MLVSISCASSQAPLNALDTRERLPALHRVLISRRSTKLLTSLDLLSIEVQGRKGNAMLSALFDFAA